MKNVIITGATGMVGKGVLLECLDDENIGKVLAVGRSSLNMSHPKLSELLHKDFSEFESVKDQLSGYHACYMCMGVSSANMKEDRYTVMTYDYTLALATTLFAKSPEMTITYVSGQGTDSSEKGRSMWARVKGKTENDLLKMGFAQAFMYRPGGIIPLRGIKSRTRLYQFFYDYFMWLIKLIKLIAPNSIVNTTQIGRSMINVTMNGCDKLILDPIDIIKTSE